MAKRASETHFLVLTSDVELETGLFSLSISGPSTPILSEVEGLTTGTDNTTTSNNATIVNNADPEGNVGIIVGSVVGGVVGMICCIGCCFLLICGCLRSHFRSSALRSNRGYVHYNIMRRPPQSHYQLFQTGTFLERKPVNRFQRQTQKMTLAFYPGSNSIIHGRGKDDYGSYVVTGVYSTRTLRMGFDKIYQKSSMNGIDPHRQETLQIQWNSRRNYFEGKSYLIDRGHHRIQKTILHQKNIHQIRSNDYPTYTDV